jgi:hypothetical protein
MIRHHVVVVSELLMANRASPALLNDLPLQQLPHLCRRPQFPVSPGVMLIFDTLHNGPDDPGLAMGWFPATAIS